MNPIEYANSRQLLIEKLKQLDLEMEARPITEAEVEMNRLVSKRHKKVLDAISVLDLKFILANAKKER